MMRTVAEHLRLTWWARALALGAVVLTLALGFCLLAGDEGGSHHLMSPDLCLGMILVSMAGISLVGLFVTRWTVFVPGAASYAVSRLILDPPPRPAPLF